MTSPLPEITTKISNQSIYPSENSTVRKTNNTEYDRWMEKT
ncbi:hypothetical protein [Sporanaerobacter acetigenes]|nr:hypothetical protein [Sporanaerobacter acetigenes]